MATRGIDPEAAEFRAADVIGPEGIGSNGELLLAALDSAYPEQLQKVLPLRRNLELEAELDRDTLGEAIAKIAGLTEVEAPGGRRIAPAQRIRRVAVRGGADEEGRNIDSALAHISYVALDDTGDNVYKGVFPYLDLEKGESDSHFAQRTALAAHPVAQAQIEARRRAAQEARARVNANPAAALDEMSTGELIDLMEQEPERAPAIKAYVQAQRGEDAPPAVLQWEPGSPEAEAEAPAAESDAPPPEAQPSIEPGAPPSSDAPPGDPQT